MFAYKFIPNNSSSLRLQFPLSKFAKKILQTSTYELSFVNLFAGSGLICS